ncbi:MAG: hypothetical protein ACXVB1_09010 [Pseudobdellovibrionaceae bacterium]
MKNHEKRNDLVIDGLIYQNTELKQKLAENENRINQLEDILKECSHTLNLRMKNQVIHNSTSENQVLNF